MEFFLQDNSAHARPTCDMLVMMSLQDAELLRYVGDANASESQGDRTILPRLLDTAASRLFGTPPFLVTNVLEQGGEFKRKFKKNG